MKQTFLPALAIPPVFPLFFDESCFVGFPVSGFAESLLESFWGPEGVRFGILPFSGCDGFSGPLLLGFDGLEGSSDGSSGLKGFDGSSEGSSGLRGFDGSSEGSSGLKGFDGSSEGPSGLRGFDGSFEGSSGLIGFDGIEGSSGLGLNGFDGSFEGSSGLIGFDGIEGSSGLGLNVPGGPPLLCIIGGAGRPRSTLGTHL